MLEDAYEQGLRKGKTWLSGRQELAGKLNLTEVQVKVFFSYVDRFLLNNNHVIALNWLNALGSSILFLKKVHSNAKLKAKGSTEVFWMLSFVVVINLLQLSYFVLKNYRVNFNENWQKAFSLLSGIS